MSQLDRTVCCEIGTGVGLQRCDKMQLTATYAKLETAHIVFIVCSMAVGQDMGITWELPAFQSEVSGNSTGYVNTYREWVH